MIRHSKFDWDCTLVEFTVDNLKVFTFNWDCTLVKSKNANKLIETLHWLICKSTTIVNVRLWILNRLSDASNHLYKQLFPNSKSRY